MFLNLFELSGEVSEEQFKCNHKLRDLRVRREKANICFLAV